GRGVLGVEVALGGAARAGGAAAPLGSASWRERVAPARRSRGIRRGWARRGGAFGGGPRARCSSPRGLARRPRSRSARRTTSPTRRRSRCPDASARRVGLLRDISGTLLGVFAWTPGAGPALLGDGRRGGASRGPDSAKTTTRLNLYL